MDGAPSAEAALYAAVRELGPAGIGSLALSRDSVPVRALEALDVQGSCALAGAAVSLGTVRSLVERGWVDAPLSAVAFAQVAACARATSFAYDLGFRRRGSLRFLDIPLLRRLHVMLAEPAVALGFAPGLVPGAWRTANAPAIGSGAVALGQWNIPTEMEAFVSRLQAGPSGGETLVAWIARTHARFTRMRPFADANGRLARLIASMALLARGYPPVTFGERARSGYVAALRTADAGDARPLAACFTAAVKTNLDALLVATKHHTDLVPLERLAGSAFSFDALRKAAVRGRLRAVVDGRRILSSHTWVEQYRAGKSSSGRPASRRSP